MSSARRARIVDGMTHTAWTIAGTDSRRARIDALVKQDITSMIEAQREQHAAWAATAGLPGITRGADVEWDEDGVTRRGTFHRMTAYGRGNRVAYVMVAVIATGGTEVHLASGTVRAATAAALPACAAFTGTGRRCGTCRVHRNTHN